jgi:hypothetical protein
MYISLADSRAKGFKKWADIHQPEKRWCSRRSERGWRHRGSGSRSRGDDAGRTAASSIARARAGYALKRFAIEEYSIAELLAGPIRAPLMKSEGVDRQTLEYALHLVASALRLRAR